MYPVVTRSLVEMPKMGVGEPSTETQLVKTGQGDVCGNDLSEKKESFRSGHRSRQLWWRMRTYMQIGGRYAILSEGEVIPSEGEKN